jgi:hypothetical protein
LVLVFSPELQRQDAKANLCDLCVLCGVTVGTPARDAV